MATAAAAIMTVEEFVKMDFPETESYELVDGELVPLPSASPLHNIVRGRLEQTVRNYFERNALGGTFGETDCRIDAHNSRKPDLCIFLGDRWLRLDLRKVPAPYAPDIAVEVLSPSNVVGDLNRKERDYLSAGSQEIWLVDVDNGEVHIRTKKAIRILQAGDSLESPLLPGFSVDVTALVASR